MAVGPERGRGLADRLQAVGWEISHLNPGVLIRDEMVLRLAGVRAWLDHRDIENVEQFGISAVLEPPFLQRDFLARAKAILAGMTGVNLGE